VTTIEISSLRILVVDDSSLVRMYYRDALEKAGYEVEQAMNGLEAMEKALAGRFDLLIVDVNMPKMDGFSFMRELRRSDAPASRIPALVITTEAGEQDVQEARAAGANFYLVKPVSESDLRDHVAVLIGARP
jgi:two-component system, chemotaxis family, chemotaxis protein CheY